MTTTRQESAMTGPRRRRRRHGFGSIEKHHRRYLPRYTNLRRERKYGPSFDTYAEAEPWLAAKCAELHAVSACCAHCGDDMLHYTDGRAVASHPRFGDGIEFVYALHPDLAHPMNRPREIATVTTRNGTRKWIHAAALGILGTVSEFPGCDRPPRILGGDDW